MPGIVEMLENCLARSSWRAYSQVLNRVHSFLVEFQLPVSLPLTPATIALYLSYLNGKGYAASTLITHMSAVAFIHKINNMKDPTASFLIQKCLQGVKNLRPSQDSRLPITVPILRKLVSIMGIIGSTSWEKLMFKSMFLLAFYAFLRVGEMTASKGDGKHTLQIDNLSLVENRGTTGLSITFQSFKHGRKPASILIERQVGNLPCPVQAWEDYLAVRGKAAGCLFMKQNGEPVSRNEFSSKLALALKACQLSSELYKSHSFRIGAATYCAGKGFNDSQIRALGRWNSDAFVKYIRFQ